MSLSGMFKEMGGDCKMIAVDVEHLIQMKKEMNLINRVDLDNIEFYKDGHLIEIPKEILDEWKYIGLNNCDFITNGFYKEGVIREKIS